MSTIPQLQTPGLFRATDRCDRCPAAARVRILLACGLELTLCAHHTRVHRAALEPMALRFEHHVDAQAAV